MRDMKQKATNEQKGRLCCVGVAREKAGGGRGSKGSDVRGQKGVGLRVAGAQRGVQMMYYKVMRLKFICY